MTDREKDQGLSPEELEQQDATELPDREAMSLVNAIPLEGMVILPEDGAIYDTMPVEPPQGDAPTAGPIGDPDEPMAS